MKDDEKKNALMLKFASIFMKNEAKSTIESLLTYYQNIDVDALMPALMSIESKYRLLANDFIRQNLDKSKNKLLHNLYLFFLAESINPSPPDELLDFLGQQESLHKKGLPLNIDKDFALNVLKYFGIAEAQIRVYGMLEFYEEAVRLAIQNNKFDVAKQYAMLPSDDKVKKKLWLDIARAIMTKNIKVEVTGLEIINESKNNLNLNDVLPFVSPKVKLKVFRHDILTQLENYGNKIDDLRKQMVEYNKNSEEIGEEIKELNGISLVISPDKFCDQCEKILLGSEKFFIFPCRHGFHRVKYY